MRKMAVRNEVLYGCKHLYEVVEVEPLYSILHHFTANCTLIVVCIRVVISQLQRHFTLFYTFYIVNVKTGVNIFFFFLFL